METMLEDDNAIIILIRKPIETSSGITAEPVESILCSAEAGHDHPPTTGHT